MFETSNYNPCQPFLELSTEKVNNTLSLENLFSNLAINSLFYSREQYKLISLILENIQDSLIILDNFDNIVYQNSAAIKLTGWSLQENEKLNIKDILCSDISNFRNSEIKQDLRLFDYSRIDFHQRFWFRDKNLKIKQIEYSKINISNYLNTPEGKILILREIKKQDHPDEFLWKTKHDLLTGLINRSTFENYMEKLVIEAEPSIAHILCYLNLDRFKVINETCGHLAGDKFLQEIGCILRQRFRKTDIISRLGGDEFGIILKNCSYEEAHKVIKNLMNDIQAYQFNWEEHHFSFTVSLGLVLINSDCNNHIKLLSAAKSACDTAKRKGRNRIHLYQENDTDVIAQRGEIQWIPKIFKAIGNDEFRLYKQPIVSLENSLRETQNSISHCEVLIRLQNTCGQLVLPGSFIPAAEKYGLMPMIDRWVIQTLFNYINYKHIPLCQMSSKSNDANDFALYMINLSGASLNDEQFLEFVEEQLDRYQMIPQRLCFEITETIAIANLSKAISLINRLKELGCYFALDDFGSGMSSFGYLKSLPIDFVKIDGIFIKDIVQNQVAREIVEAINRIAHVMQIKTIAEYVEDEATYVHLQQLGVDFAQGFGISKPNAL